MRPRQTKSLDELLQGVWIILAHPDQNDLKTKYMTEAGLYQLTAKTPFAEALQDWVEQESIAKHQADRVLLSIDSCSCCKANQYMAGQALGRQRVDEVEKR